MSSILASAAVFAAGGGNGVAPTFLQSHNIKGLIIFVAGIAIMLVGVLMVGKSHKGRLKDNAERGANVLLAVVVIALGAGFAFLSFGDKFLSFFLG